MRLTLNSEIGQDTMIGVRFFLILQLSFFSIDCMANNVHSGKKDGKEQNPYQESLNKCNGPFKARKPPSEALKPGANLCGADLSGIDFRALDLSNVNLLGANISSANLQGVVLNWANLSFANIVGSNLTKAELKGANLSEALLDGAILTGASLWKANLYKTSLVGANLMLSDLSGTDSRDANFSGADIRGASFLKANLEHAYFAGADLAVSGFEPTVLPDIEAIVGAKGLEEMRFTHIPSSLIKLRKAFREGGVNLQGNAITAALQRSNQHNLHKEDGVFSAVEFYFKEVFLNFLQLGDTHQVVRYCCY